MNVPHNSGREVFRSLFAFPWNVFVGTLVGALIVRAVLLQMFAIPSESMQPTLRPGDRILVEKVSKHITGISRGDLVVFDASDVWTAPGVTNEYVKRVIAVGGDRVQCCTSAGEVLVNGKPIAEPYLFATGKTREFDVLVQADRLWLLGDHRAASADSSAFRGVPGGGSVPESRVIGKAVAIVWPPSRAGILSTSNEGSQ